ncbi:hypothetical protein AJ88_35800 [Mesorhizobium amorphae CCBAU 01583]|nr:hypothetical protein AJ88_35800 [Mesorhizobium amorphae CCBAU 01583]
MELKGIFDCRSAVFAGISNSMFRRSLSQERLMTLACVAYATCSLSLALTSSTTVAAIALALGGAGWVIAWSGVGVSVQLASPRWVVGRTISIYYALIDGGIALGSWVWGTVAQNHSLTLALEGSAGALLLVAAAGVLFPLPERRETRSFGGIQRPSRRSQIKAEKRSDRGQGRISDP